MADLKYTVQVDTKGAERNVNNLKETILDAGKILAGAFVIREIGQFISSTVQAASSVENLGVTLGTLYGSAEEAGRALQIVEESAAKLPISLQAIQQGIPSLALVEEQFGGLQNAIEFTAGLASTFQLSFADAGLQVQRALTSGINSAELLKDRGVAAFLGFEQGATYTAEQTRDAFLDNFDAIVKGNEKAAETMTGQFSMLGDAVFQFQKEVGQAFSDELKEAVSTLTSAFNDNKEAILSFARVIGDVLGASIIFVIDNAKTLITVISAAFGAAVAVKILTVTTAALKLAKSFNVAAIAAATLQAVSGIAIPKLLAGIAGAAAAAIAINQITGDATENIGDLNDELDTLKKGDNKSSGPLTDDATKKIDDHAKALRDVLAPHKKFIDQAKEFANTDYRTELEKANQRVTDAQIVIEQLNLAFERSNGQIDNFVGLLRGAQNELTAATADVDKLTQSAADLAAEGTFAKFYDDVVQGSKDAQREIEFSRQAVEKLTKDFFAGKISVEVYKDAVDKLNASLGVTETALRDLVSTSLDFQKDIRESTADAQRSFDQLSMSPLERELDDIASKLTQDLSNTKRALQDAMQVNPELSDEYTQEIKNLTEATNEAIVEQQELARQSYETQRSFEYGWKRAFEEYADNASNAALKAEKIFDKTTQGMEDMIVDFAKTGKLEWKSFVADMLETLLRSQLQSAMAQIFNIGTSGGSAGNVLGGLFAGFFANGGLIPGGSFGVVGENGPELVSGPAQVTPMTGGGPVTYNISAVDAQSFKQLVARDPGFIHAVASQGGKKVPVRR